jgi:signal transduction histidine kinase
MELEFKVSDTGIGILKNKMDRLFKPFSQIDSSMIRKYGGTGLGLSIQRLLNPDIRKAKQVHLFVSIQIYLGKNVYLTCGNIG